MSETPADASRAIFLACIKGMKMVSRHTLEGEGAAPFAEQVLIYPRWDMDALADTIEQLSKGRR